MRRTSGDKTTAKGLLGGIAPHFLPIPGGGADRDGTFLPASVPAISVDAVGLFCFFVVMVRASLVAIAILSLGASRLAHANPLCTLALEVAVRDWRVAANPPADPADFVQWQEGRSKLHQAAKSLC